MSSDVRYIVSIGDNPSAYYVKPEWAYQAHYTYDIDDATPVHHDDIPAALARMERDLGPVATRQPMARVAHDDCADWLAVVQ